MNHLSDVAISAGNCYRALDGLMEEFERMNAENPKTIELFDRFLSLHREFYENIILLTSEDSGEVDEEFRKEVSDEYQKLREVVQYLKKEKGFLEAIKGKFTGKAHTMADYFAHCVDDIFNGYGIDPDTNEIYIICD